MSFRPHTRRPAVLASAVLVGGLALGAASPALAAPAPTADGVDSGWFVSDAEHGRFYTEHHVQDVRVTVAPITITSGEDEVFRGERGPETGVAFSYDAELERGLIDFTQERRVLAETGTGDVVFTLYVDGTQRSSIVFGPDGHLGDDVPGEIKGTFGPHQFDTSMRPTVDHVTLMSAPGSRMVHLTGNSSGDAPGNASLTVAEEPAHGTLVELDRVGNPGMWRPGEERGIHASWVYVADEGFTGTDEAVFTLTDDRTGATKTLVVTYSIGDDRADDTVLDPHAGALPFDESRVWADLDAQDDDAAAPVPADPSDDEPGDDADHTVPEKVETGSGQAWWLAALGAAGTGALLAARRRLGLTR